MTPTDSEGEKLLSEFGRIIAKDFDYALMQLRSELTGTERISDIKLRKYLSTLSSDDRLVAIAQRALEIFLHDFLFSIESSDVYHLVGNSSGGNTLDLKDFADAGLQTEQLYWLEDFSTLESVGGRLIS